MSQKMNWSVHIVLTSSEGNRYETDTQVQARNIASAKVVATEVMRLNNPGYSVIAKKAYLIGAAHEPEPVR